MTLIGIDASRATVSQRTGTEGYSLNIIEAMLRLKDEVRFRLYFRDDPPEGLLGGVDRVEKVVIKRRRLWTHTGLRSALQDSPPDVLFVPAHVLPWPDSAGVPAVVTIHDLGYLHYPDKHPLGDRLYLDWSTRYSANNARRVIAVSQATAQDLINFNGVPAERVRVIHSGVDPDLHPVDDPAQIEAIRQKLGIDGPYLLHVGSLQPRKNLTRLVRAFGLVGDDHPALKLVLAGKPLGGYESLRREIRRMHLEDRVLLAGYVPDEDLPALYSGAAAYVFPSLYEGFGFPAVEAMACGVPVVCSNTSSLPELVGDAALTFAPTDVRGQAEAIQAVLKDEALRQSLREKGFKRRERFSWERCARETLDVLLEVAHESALI
jgi:glycosyltransferase involved in cell wall biosynthesis